MQQNKVEAIYALRDAAETKALAEREAAKNPSARARDTLMAAQLELESKTQDAIEVCHECGHNHNAGEPHAGNARFDNVIEANFRKMDRNDAG